MTNQTPESSQGLTEATAPATPKFSEVPVVAASEHASAEDALIEKVLGRLTPEIEKRVQATKDKRFAGLDKLGGVDELLKLKDFIKQQGGDVDKGVREYQIDQLLNQAPTPPASPAPVANRPAVDASAIQTRATEILTDAAIKFDDPEYTALVNKPHANPDAFIHEVEKFARRRLKQAFQPGAASNAGDGGGAAAVTDKEVRKDQLSKRLAELNKNPRQNAAEAAKVRAELQGLAGPR